MATTNEVPAAEIKALRVFIVNETQVSRTGVNNSFLDGWAAAWEITFNIIRAASPKNTTQVVDANKALALMLAPRNTSKTTDLWVVDASGDQVTTLRSVYLSSVDKATVGLYYLKKEEGNDGSLSFHLVEPPPADAE